MRASVLRPSLLAAALVLLVAAPVLAAGPVRQFLPAPSDIFLPGGNGTCTFDVNIHVDANREYLKLWFDSTGNVHLFAVSGNLQVTATNMRTGASVHINASGPGRGVFDAQGNLVVNVSAGHFLNFFPLSLTTGLLDFNTGVIRGRTTDLCAALS